MKKSLLLLVALATTLSASAQLKLQPKEAQAAQTKAVRSLELKKNTPVNRNAPRRLTTENPVATGYALSNKLLYVGLDMQMFAGGFDAAFVPADATFNFKAVTKGESSKWVYPDGYDENDEVIYAEKAITAADSTLEFTVPANSWVDAPYIVATSDVGKNKINHKVVTDTAVVLGDGFISGVSSYLLSRTAYGSDYSSLEIPVGNIRMDYATYYSNLSSNFLTNASDEVNEKLADYAAWYFADDDDNEPEVTDAKTVGFYEVYNMETPSVISGANALIAVPTGTELNPEDIFLGVAPVNGSNIGAVANKFDVDYAEVYGNWSNDDITVYKINATAATPYLAEGSFAIFLSTPSETVQLTPLTWLCESALRDRLNAYVAANFTMDGEETVGLMRPLFAWSGGAYVSMGWAFGVHLSFNEAEIEELTGISDVKAASKSGNAIYDLQGRRVSEAKNGLYIQNGKKVFVK